MSLDINKLEKVVEFANGAKRARCPACAEAGQDVKGEHLRVYPDGRFGCCVYAGDSEHRKRIFALAGIHERQGIRVKVAVARTPTPVQSGLLGRLGRVFGGVSKPATHITADVGTLGTDQFIYTCEKKNPEKDNDIEKLKGFQPCVPSVPRSLQPTTTELSPRVADERLPFLTAGGDLSIPFDSPERYHWWRGGQRVAVTLAEVREQMSDTTIGF